MALNLMLSQRWLLLSSLLCVFYSSLIPLCHGQLGSPQNIETFYPFQASAPSRPPVSSPEQLASPPSSAAASKSSSSNSKIAKAVAATAAATLVVSGIIFLIIHKCLKARRRRERVESATSTDRRIASQSNGFERINGNVRGLIVDENGLDVVYWRKLRGRYSKREFRKEVLRSAKKKENQEQEEGEEAGTEGRKSESAQDFPLLRGKSSTSHLNIVAEEDELNRISRRAVLVNSDSGSLSPPRPPPILTRKNPPPPPPPPPRPPALSKPPPTPQETRATTGKLENFSGESGNGQIKLEHLHREKVDGGSSRVDENLMEALFGYVATRRSPKGKRLSDAVNPSGEASAQG